MYILFLPSVEPDFGGTPITVVVDDDDDDEMLVE